MGEQAIAAATMVKLAPGDDQGRCQLVTIEHDDGESMDWLNKISNHAEDVCPRCLTTEEVR